jgi:hypothetical protein
MPVAALTVRAASLAVTLVTFVALASLAMSLAPIAAEAAVLAAVLAAVPLLSLLSLAVSLVSLAPFTVMAAVLAALVAVAMSPVMFGVGPVGMLRRWTRRAAGTQGQPQRGTRSATNGSAKDGMGVHSPSASTVRGRKSAPGTKAPAIFASVG